MLDNTISKRSYVWVLLSVLAPSTPAQEWIDAQEIKLRASTPSASALFGRSVAIDGELAVAGAPLDDNSTGNDAGAAYVLQRVGSTWTEVAELIGSAGSSTDLFGESVDIHGTTIVVGASLDDPGGVNAAGSAYVFTICSGLWTEIAQLTHPSPSPGDRFGTRVAIHGDTIAVSAAQDDTCATDAGSVFVYARNKAGTPLDPCDDSWVLQAEIAPSVCQAGATFGASVDLDEGWLVVGAPLQDAPDTDRGIAFVFERVGTSWAERFAATALDGAAGDGLGGAVAIGVDTVVVGASLDDAPHVDQGSAYVFRRIGTSWYFEQKLTHSQGAAGDLFGSAATLDGELAVIGGHGSDEAGESTGSALLFARNGALWHEARHITSGDAAAGDEFGVAVALAGTTLIAGADREDDTLSNAGAAYVLTLSLGNFERYGFGDGSATPCPCGNQSHPRLEQGCVNSRGWGGKLSVAGSDSATADDFRVLASNLVPGNPALLFHGPNRINGGAGLVFGNGLRLVGGVVERAGLFVPDAGGRAVWGPGIAGSARWIPGVPVHFQVWYRDPSDADCGDVFNLTNAVTVTFRP